MLPPDGSFASSPGVADFFSEFLPVFGNFVVVQLRLLGLG